MRRVLGAQIGGNLTVAYAVMATLLAFVFLAASWLVIAYPAMWFYVALVGIFAYVGRRIFTTEDKGE